MQILDKCRLSHSSVRLPWLADKFANTDEALAAAFAAADPEESSGRLQLHEYRAAREYNLRSAVGECPGRRTQ